MSSETQPRNSRTLLIGGLVVALVVTAAVIFLLLNQVLNTPDTNNSGLAVVDSDSYFDGATVIDPPRPLTDFTLTADSGEPMSLSDLRGKVVLLYFGYTNCPDICPITLGDYKQVKADLGDLADDVAFLMISVDGTRDTPDRMASYLENFDPEFIGMTGEDQVLTKIGADYGLYYEVQQGENYTVDHTASIFMINPDMELTTVFTYGTEPEVITEDIRDLLS
ncbi:MAG: SCO family protein [Anaerolineae bacterium]|nr:SCO family protein [Anaerolineae bacterium]